MTQSKREPFAVVETEPKQAHGLFVRLGNDKLIRGIGTLEIANEYADKINAAHEARVKEEIEAMRLKTIRMCADKADRMGSEEIRNAILFETLPTELEGK